MGAQLDHVESRSGNEFEREIERLRRRDCLRHSGGYSRVAQPAKGALGSRVNALGWLKRICWRAPRAGAVMQTYDEYKIHLLICITVRHKR
jgi:hypothetical protein